jgi:hypothetical protein
MKRWTDAELPKPSLLIRSGPPWSESELLAKLDHAIKYPESSARSGAAQG